MDAVRFHRLSQAAGVLVEDMGTCYAVGQPVVGYWWMEGPVYLLDGMPKPQRTLGERLEHYRSLKALGVL